MRVYYLILCGAFFTCSCDTLGAMSYDHDSLKQPDGATEENERGTSKTQALNAIDRIQETNLKKSSIQRLGVDLTIVVNYLEQVQEAGHGDESAAHLVSSIRSAAAWSPNTQKGKLNQIKNMTRQAEKIMNRSPDE